MYSWAQRVWRTVSSHEKISLLGSKSKKKVVSRESVMTQLVVGNTKHKTPFTVLPPVQMRKEEKEILEVWKHDLFGSTASETNDNNTNRILNDLVKHHKWLGLEIPKEYGGVGTSPYVHSKLLQYLVTWDKKGNWVHRIMVPNSLGPAQLLLHYGTEKEKTEYLPRLASGELIPCFGLTGPFNGSDATAFPLEENGKIIVKEKNEKNETNSREIHLPYVHKRWITLSPIANLIGLAVRLENKITLLLIDLSKLSSSQKSKIQIRKHQPIGSEFPNGEIIIRDLTLSLDTVLGGHENIGKGWPMLVDCLSHGRGISLPSVSDAGSRYVLWHTLWYSCVRKQFQQPLIEIPAVESMIADMTLRIYLGKVVMEYYHSLLAQGETSSSLSAVMKWLLTTWSRDVVLCGMDIFAGKGITMGPKNPIAHFYLQNPIPITVEGSNCLTKHVIIPIQTLMEHHHHFQDILQSLEEENPQQYYSTVKNIITSIFGLGGSMVTGTFVDKRIAYTSLYSYRALLTGKHLRTRQDVSGTLAMMITGSFVAMALQWYEKQHGVTEHLSSPCKQFIQNYFFRPSSTPSSTMNHHSPKEVREIAQHFLRNENSRTTLLEADLYLHHHPEYRQVQEKWDVWKTTSGEKKNISNFTKHLYSLDTLLVKQMIEVDTEHEN
jgi:alkylation response protein AidB-like acyl-CoA dehydrogenase